MSDVLLDVRELSQTYKVRAGEVKAVSEVSFSLAAGETLGLAGESGCGKSSIGRSIMRLQKPTGGEVLFEGRDVAQAPERALTHLRRGMQMVFQDPYASLNPRTRIGRTVEEPLIVHRLGDRAARKARVRWLLEKVGLPQDAERRFPHEFSGGQRQRVGIARALAPSPKLLICDEAVSALDVSVKAQVVNLLLDLQEELGLAYLFISHDLKIIQHVADRVGIMYLGRLVETAPTHALWSRPQHPYTRALLGAAPGDAFAAGRPHRRTVVYGEVPSPLNPPGGCPFHPRCPRATAICSQTMPALESAGHRHEVACHHPG